MNRVARLAQLARAAWSGNNCQASQAVSSLFTAQVPATICLLPSLLHNRGFAAAAGDSIATDYEQATGLERAEIEGKQKGIDIFKEDWLDAPWGTEEAPVVVPSAFTERVVGVPDPYDDSIIWWGAVKEGEPPRQIVEGGEFFVLKRTAEEGGHGH